MLPRATLMKYPGQTRGPLFWRGGRGNGMIFFLIWQAWGEGPGMGDYTKQMEVWDGEFGRSWTQRCDLGVEGTDQRFLEDVGCTRSAMYQEFLGDMDRQMRMLEVACNIGTQLETLRGLGFDNLYGAELQKTAVAEAHSRRPHLNVVQGSAFDLPFKDGFFDLVYTSVFLIHVAPPDLPRALAEVHRCSRRYIMGYEYFAETCTEVPYRDHEDLLWKTDFCGAYLAAFPELKVIKRRMFDYADGKRDEMFLLAKP